MKATMIAVAMMAAAVTSAHAQVVTTCQSVGGRGWRTTSCETTVTTPAPAAEPFRRGSGTAEEVLYDPAEAARVLAIQKHDPDSVPLCPWRVTRDGCQP